MEAILIPSKIIIAIGDDGKCVSATLQYKTRLDGVIDGTFRTMDVKAGFANALVQELIDKSIDRAKVGEGTSLSKRRETAEQVKTRINENLSKKKQGGAK